MDSLINKDKDTTVNIIMNPLMRDISVSSPSPSLFKVDKSLSLGKRSHLAFEYEWKELKNPRNVEIAWNVSNVTGFDTVSCRCEIDFYIYLSWIDPAMVGIELGDPIFKRTAEEYELLWNPRVEVNSAVDLRECLDADSGELQSIYF